MEYWDKNRTMIARIKGGEGIDLFGNRYINFNVAHRNNTKMRRLTLFIFN